MSRALKVYNEFDELILHVEHAQRDSRLQVIDGTPEMSRAIRALQGHDFERAAIIDGQLCEFRAAWDEPDFLDAVAGFWTANFGWRTRIVQKSPKFTRLPESLVITNVVISNVMIPTAPKVRPSASFFYDAFVCPREVFAVRTFQFDDLVTNIACSMNNEFVLAYVTENDKARKPELVVLRTAA